MAVAQWMPVVVPELGADEIEVVQWLVEIDSPVSLGDRLLELLADGVLFHLSADVSGVLMQLDCQRGGSVHAGETLGWIEPADESFPD
jgi:pyruvate/2-oxoglutarate dehydrogenase complex dihydrolipoamide acyltransferase (E2) component